MNRSKWADRPGALEKARAWLEEQYPGEVVVILDTFDIAYAGWEGDNDGALVIRDGKPDLVIIDGTYATVPVLDTLTDQLGEYRRLIEQTAVVLRQYWYRVGNLNEISRTDRTEQQRAMATAYHYVSILEHMTNRGARDVAEALRTAVNDIIERPEEIANSQRLFEDVLREVAPFTKLPMQNKPGETGELAGDLPDFDPTYAVTVDEAAAILDTSAATVLHRMRIGDLHLRRSDVEALRDREAPRRRALAGYWEASQALEQDANELTEATAAVKLSHAIEQARLGDTLCGRGYVVIDGEPVNLRTPHGIMTAWSRGKIATKQAMALMECDFDELVQAAISSDVPLPEDLK